jgi:pimeloyl-ACP methyl ester carboxylesterase
MERLASFTRLIRIDRRGMGLSDRVTGPATLEERMDDVRVVLDEVGSERAALIGISEGGGMCSLFAASFPKRVERLILANTYATFLSGEGHPGNMTPDAYPRFLHAIEKHWGTGISARFFAPRDKEDEEAVRSWARLERNAVSPGGARALFELNGDLDVRHILPSICVPTLVLHSRGDPACTVEGGRYLARNIPGARYVELDSDDHVPWSSDNCDLFLGEIEEFLTGARGVTEPDRVLKTVMFADMVDSTKRAAELGDRAWGGALAQFQATIRTALATWHGEEIDTAGDGFFAAFDGPARAVRCACAIREALGRRSVAVRIGLHTGECELIGGKLGGIAVHTGARVAAEAAADEVLVSSTVKDLVAGSGLTFDDRGERSLKGLHGQWQMYAATG